MTQCTCWRMHEIARSSAVVILRCKDCGRFWLVSSDDMWPAGIDEQGLCELVESRVYEGFRQLLIAVLHRAALDIKNRKAPVLDEVPARDFLYMPQTRRLAEVVGLLPGGGR